VGALLKSLPQVPVTPLDTTEAMTLAAYPLSCLDHPQAQPGSNAQPGANIPGAAALKPGQPRPAYLWQPAGLTRLLAGYDHERAFYGCYDWHSAVNSTWTLVTLLKRYPELPLANLIREKLNAHLGKTNLAGELEYFQTAKAFERPYGQAWLLKFYGELLTWNDPDAKKWAANMAPLAQFFSKNLTGYLTKMPTPIRQGVHPNTAFDMDLLLPYTEQAHDAALRGAIESTARRFYANDRECPTAYEPEGVSFLSPCLVEGALMSHLLDRNAFAMWFGSFMPAMNSAAFRPLLQPFDASKMTREQMAGQSHLIGLAFSRAGAMLTIAEALPGNDPRAEVLRRLAAIHAAQGFKTLDRAGYLETHWIASYALLYELDRPAAAPGAAIASR
ncbi:MAG: DUF2891 family protein, partial [Terriglobales bacterium]